MAQAVPDLQLGFVEPDTQSAANERVDELTDEPLLILGGVRDEEVVVELVHRPRV